MTWRWRCSNGQGNFRKINLRKEGIVMKKFAKVLCAIVALGLLVSSMALAEGYNIGVIQYASHPSLDNCYTGFLQGLDAAGVEYEVDFQNAMGDMSNSDLQAKTMASQGVDMIVAIATPAAMSAYAAAREEEIPVVFVAVSDAVAAGIVQSNEQPGGCCTGVSDVLNLEAQVQMIRAFLPDAATIGVIYTTSEPNSITHLEKLESIAPEYGFAVEAVGITGPSEVAAAAATLVSKGVDCINNFTDNNVVDNLSVVLHAADEAGIPVFGSEEEQVKNGCLATQGIDYISLGEAAGQMAGEILLGADPAQTPVAMVDEVTPCYNSQVAQKLGTEVPQELLDAGMADLAE